MWIPRNLQNLIFYLARISNALIKFYNFTDNSILDLLLTLSPFARREIKGKICVSGFVSLFRAVFDIDFPEKALFEPNDLLYIYYNKHSHRTETKKGTVYIRKIQFLAPFSWTITILFDLFWTISVVWKQKSRKTGLLSECKKFRLLFSPQGCRMGLRSPI